MTIDTNCMEIDSTRLLINIGRLPLCNLVATNVEVILAGSRQCTITVLMWVLALFTTVMTCPAEADDLPRVTLDSAPLLGVDSFSLNTRVLAAIEKMPVGGGYAVTPSASRALGNAIGLDKNGCLSIKATLAKPSFCSGAVYLVLLSALKPEIDEIRDPEIRRTLIRTLDAAGQPDGKGIWGRWNSNGPCMAVTFAASGLGRSFWGCKSAVPGDFLKLWWTEAIGRDESGHSVVFLGFKKTESGDDGIEIWSSNKPGGYGKKVIPLSKIKHALVSRCEHPNRVVGLLHLNGKDDYLAGMLKRNTTPDDVEKQIALTAPVSSSGGIR